MPRVAPYLSIGAVSLDRSSAMPLHRQLYRSIRDKILTTVLQPGERLPSTRVLADELRLGRNTVVNAFNQLIAEGFLESETGSGTIVSLSLPEELTGAPPSAEGARGVGMPSGHGMGAAADGHRPPAANPAATRAASAAFPPDRGARETIPGLSVVSTGSKDAAAPRVGSGRNPRLSGRTNALMDVPYLEESRLKPFTPAVPFIDERFVTIWGTLMNRTWRRMTGDQFGYPSALGYQPLREAIASYLRTVRGVKCLSRQIVITDGAQQALNLTAAMLLNPGDRVWIEDPSYDGAKAAFRGIPADLVPVPVDGNGMVVEAAIEAEPEAVLAYISPSNQYPLGVTMDLQRRLQLIRWAEERGSWIIEDDYDSEFRYAGPPVMSLQGIDRSERVIYIGTFSKVLFPGLRLGYMVVPADLIEPLHAMRAHADRGSPLFEQMVLNEYIRGGHFARHIRRMRKLYGERRSALVDALKEHLGDILSLGDGQAGLHIVAYLPRGIDDAGIARALRIRGYEVPCLSSYSLKPPARGGLLFGFTALDPEEMDEAVMRMRPALVEAMDSLSHARPLRLV